MAGGTISRRVGLLRGCSFRLAVLLAVTLNAGPVDVKTAPVFNPSVCAKKRVDACGCHHVYGVRHCHPKRRSDHCEAMVQASEPEEREAAEPGRESEAQATVVL
jgi:hypothetical protein